MFNDPNLTAASLWVKDLIQGQLATAVAMLMIAVLGYQMLSGRLSRKTAFQVVLGCFILFGSSAIAGGLMNGLRDTEPQKIPEDAGNATWTPRPSPSIVRPTPAPFHNSGNPFDPYSGNPGQK
jgi:hypothetical protein